MFSYRYIQYFLYNPVSQRPGAVNRKPDRGTQSRLAPTNLTDVSMGNDDGLRVAILRPWTSLRNAPLRHCFVFYLLRKQH